MITVLVRYWKPLLVLLLATLYTGAVYAFASHNTANHYERLKAEAAAALNQAQLDLLKETANGAMDAALLAEERKRKATPIIQTVTKWRTRYASNPDSGQFHPSAEFVRTHDAAASGRMPDPASGVPDGPGGITDIEVLATVTDNYALCRKWRDQLIYIKELYDGKR